MKKLLPIICCGTILLTILSGCNLKQKTAPLADKNRNMLTYSVDNIGKNNKQAPPNGYYVLHNNVLHPFLRIGADNTIRSPATTVWFGKDYEKLIPTMSINDKILYINNSKPPQNALKVYRLNDHKYAVGMQFDVSSQTDEQDNTKQETIQFATMDSSFCPTSKMRAFISNLQSKYQGNLIVKEINGKPFTSANLKHNMLYDLNYDDKLQLGFYCGTQYGRVNILADTRYLVESTKQYHIDSYIETKAGYFLFDLPSDITNGFYYIDKLGTFQMTNTTDEENHYQDYDDSKKRSD